MEKQYQAKVFKSGNSLALRLPKELGLKEGTTMLLREERSTFIFQPSEEARKTIDISGFAGKMPGFKAAPRELREMEARELDWDGLKLKRNG